MDREVAVDRPRIWATIGALLVTAALAIGVGYAAAFLLAILFRTGTSGGADWWASLVGINLGLASAKAACDRWLRPYSTKAIFVALVLLHLPVMAFPFVEPAPFWFTVRGLVQVGVTIASGWYWFWLDKRPI